MSCGVGSSAVLTGTADVTIRVRLFSRLMQKSGPMLQLAGVRTVKLVVMEFD